MNPVFLDTVGLIACWNRSDQWHLAAAGCLATLVATRVPLVTTSYVLLECGNAAARQPYRPQVSRLRDELTALGRLVEPTLDDVETAWRAYRSVGMGAAGIVDQVSFAVMRRLGLHEAFTNDQHFASAGFSVLF